MTDGDGERGEPNPTGTRRFRTATAQVGALSAALMAASAVAFLVTPDVGSPLRDGGPWVVLLVAAGFLVAEPLVFHIEARNEAVSFSPTDLPLAYGMLFVSPVALVVARILAGALGLVVWRRQPPFKLAFNVSVYAAETMIAVLVFRLLMPGEADATPFLWATMALALLVALVSSGALIAVAIACFENDLATRLRAELSHSYVFYLPEAVIATTAVVPSLAEPWFASVSLVPMVAMWLVLRSHGSLLHRHSDLTHMHHFSHAVGRSQHLEDIATAAVDEVARLLRAGRVALVVWDDADGNSCTTVGAPELTAALPSRPGDRAWRSVLAARDVVEVGDQRRGIARRLGVDHAVVVPLVDDTGPLGLLVVADRRGAVSRFGADEIDRLSSISQQLTVALRKGQLYLRVQHQATHDRLTGLGNRVMFETHADVVLGRGDPVALLLLDLDRFKEVNDTMGHHAGDELLVQVAHRLRSVMIGDGMLARLGGDEFVLLATGCDATRAEQLGARVALALDAPFDIHDASVSVGASVGVALAPDHGDDATSLLRRADLAMYAAKRSHHDVVVFDDHLDDSSNADRLGLYGDLRAALRLGALDVHYQPKIEVATGRVVGAEALVRWDHPSLGALGPDQFIPLAEQTGLILGLTDHVLTTALGTVRRWHDHGHPHMGVSVNVSAQSLVDDRFPDLVTSRLSEAGLPGEFLTLEITESAVMTDKSRARLTLERLGELGVHISIDDFGTGYSSLANLRRLPISELKIDRSFVTHLLDDDSDRAIVRSTIELGHSLGLWTVAEGVETQAHADELRRLGCDQAQGYGISRPLSRDRFDAWLADRSSHLARSILTAAPVPVAASRR